MNDLLGEARPVSRYAEQRRGDDFSDIELGFSSDEDDSLSGRDEENPSFVDEFFTTVADIKDLLDQIRKNTKELEGKYNESFATVKNQEKLKEMRSDVDSLRTTNKDKIDKVKLMLEEIKERNKELEKKEPGSSELRIRENQHANLLSEFMEATRNFQRVNAEYKERHRNNLARQIRIANRDATDEEIDAIIEDPNFSEANFFAKRLMYASSAAQTAQSMYDEIKETRDDLLKLETDMNELSSMFQDFHVLVLQQQDLIDNIERNVQRATNHIKKGISNLNSARKHQKKSSLLLLFK